jgi:hypothetical protein
MPRNNRRSYSPNPRMTCGPIPRNNATNNLAGYFRAGPPTTRPATYSDIAPLQDQVRTSLPL